jgi:hypothetical protein
MRGWAYGERGASLAPDDRDAVHCVYPHAVRVLSPDGGEIATAGSVQRVAWVLSPEAGPSSGAVDVELSADGGTTWAVLAAAWPADRPLDWTVTAPPGTAHRVRVVRRTAVEGFACTADASDGSFAILAAAGAGTVPDGRDGPPLTLGKGAGGTLDLAWSAPCASPSRYAVYAGTLATLARGQWDHVPLTCQADLAGVIGLPMPGGDLYLLIAAVGASSEGPLGLTSDGAPRPASTAACAPRAAVSCGTGVTMAP